MRSEDTKLKYGEGSYILIKFDEDYAFHLVEEVNRLILEGFKPLGGISVRVGGVSGANIYQAMLYSDNANN